MAENSKIEWCHHTFNPWLGCTKISPACDHCFAEAWSKRAGRPELWQGERARTTAAYWKEPMKWDRRAAAAGERHRVFCGSLMDIWDNQADPVWRRDLFDLIAATPHLDWLLLSKRPQNIARLLPPALGEVELWPLKNVWLGMTAEDQEHFDARWRFLAAVPAVVRFVSYEPALGPLSLPAFGLRPDWIICGGETGHGARLMPAHWARDLSEECDVLGAAFFMKQMTGKAEIPADLMVRKFPKARAA